MTLNVNIASVPDRDEVVAEIWQGDDMVAELSRYTNGDLNIEIYPPSNADRWIFKLDEFRAAISEAQLRIS